MSFIMARVPHMVTTDRGSPRFLCEYLDFFQTIHTGGREQWYLQDAISYT